jgi:phosphoribosylanthranilate isomerase
LDELTPIPALRRTRIKICGITRVEDAEAAARLGADAIGLVFHGTSPRAVTIAHAKDIADALPPFTCKVALFVDADHRRVSEVIGAIRPELLQFHGRETPHYCAQFGVPFLKAFRVGEPGVALDLLESSRKFSMAKALLLDAFVAGEAGGGGQVFDWTLIPAALRPRIVLAGGLTPDNVGVAVRDIRPWAVDVSSGVEGAQKGKKDHAKIAAFIESVRKADSPCN